MRKNAKIILMLLFATSFVLNLVQNVRSYDVILVTTQTKTLSIDHGWQVTNTSDTPLLPEHQYTWNAQRNHLYNPSSLNPAELWHNTSNYFTNDQNQSVQVRDFEYTTNILYNYSRYNKIEPGEFVYQVFADYIPTLTLRIDNAVNITLNNRVAYIDLIHLLGFSFGTNGYFPGIYSVFYTIPPGGVYGVNVQPYPNFVTTLRLHGNAYTLNVRMLNGSFVISGYGSTTYYTEFTFSNYLDTAYLNSTTLIHSISLEVGTLVINPASNPFPFRTMVYAENANWWLPDPGSTFIAFPGTNQEQKSLNVLGFSETDITTFIPCRYINYQKPLSWSSRFSQNLTVSRHSYTKYFTEFPQIAYQTSYFPVLDTYDIFNVTTNYYVAAWGMLFNATKYNRTSFQVYTTGGDFMMSASWEITGYLNLTLLVLGTQHQSLLPVSYVTTNDFLETGFFVINGTHFGALLGQKLILFNVITGLSNSPHELRVYGCMFRGSEVRDNINVTEYVAQLAWYFHDDGTLIPLFSVNLFLSRYRSVALSLTYSFDITSPVQEDLRFVKNWTFSASDIYFREGQSRAYFTATSTRTTLSILYLMRIMQSDTEYSRAQLYNRTINHNDLAGKHALQSVRIDIALQYVMLTLDYIVPTVLQFEISLQYYIFADNKPPSVLDTFLSAPVVALFIPLIVFVMFPVIFYDASGKRKIFAGIGLVVGSVLNGVLGYVPLILSILFAIISAAIVYLMVKSGGAEL